MGGLLVVVAAFATGTERQLSVSVAGEAHDCGPSISASWLVPGTPDPGRPDSAAGRGEQRVAAVCGSVVRESQVLVLTLMGAGALLALAGWTALRVPRAQPPSVRGGARSVRA